MFTKEEFIRRVFIKYNNKLSNEKDKPRDKNGKQLYWSQVKYLTRKIDKSSICGYDADNLLTREILKSASFKVLSTSKLLVIDHKVSIDYGFKNNIPASNIAHISNLRFIPSNQNSKKNSESFIDDDNRWIIQNL